MDKAAKYYKKGRQEYVNAEYYRAIEHFQQSLASGGPKKECNYYIAEGYRLENKIHEATPYYQAAIEQGTQEDNAYFYLGFAEKANGNYDAARTAFENYLGGGQNFDHINRAREELVNLQELRELIEIQSQRQPLFGVDNAQSLNTDQIEYAPAWVNGELYFTTSRGNVQIYEGQGTGFTDIWIWKFDGTGPYSGTGKPLEGKVNLPYAHEATPTFTPDFKTMYFARSGYGKKHEDNVEVNIMRSDFIEGEWSEPVLAPFSDPEFWDSSPSLSVDGKRIYFSSNREGGFGQTDIWFADWDESTADWGEVQNAGLPINTDGEDEFPYVAPDGSLYFSSDGHTSFGLLDIFHYHMTPRGKMEVENLGKPINTSYDDFGITYISDSLGYISSNRPGGQGDDDLWSFVDKRPKKPEAHYILLVQVKGKVLDTVEQKVLDELTILPGSKVTLLDTADNVIATALTNDSTSFARFEIEPEQVFNIKAERQTYLSRTITWSGKGITVDPKDFYDYVNIYSFDTLVVLEPLVKQKLEFPPIYFDYNKWNVRRDAAKILDDMVRVLKDNPEIKVEIGSHTDPRNTFEYNDLLSTKRAKSVVDYIISKGIPKNQIYAKGYGERVPLTLERDLKGFKKGVTLTHEYILALPKEEQEAAYELDRRTEFTIVEILPKAVDPSQIEVIKSGEVEQVIEEEKVENEGEMIRRLEAGESK